MIILVCTHLVYCIIMIIARPDVHTSIATGMHMLAGSRSPMHDFQQQTVNTKLDYYVEIHMHITIT